MSDLTIRWPDEEVERIEAARGRLDVAGARLAARDPDDLLAALGAVWDGWRDERSGWRARLLDEHPSAAGFSREVVEAGLSLGLEAWTGDAFRRAVEGERRSLLADPGRVLLPFASTSVVLGGAIPMPSLLQPMLSLALASPVLVKPASRDPVTARLLADSIAEVDEELGRAIEVVSFPPDDAAGLDRFLGSECVVASGADATIAAIGARLHGGQRFVAYGHRLSIAVLDGDSVQADPDGLAAAVARDVALWDQLGCLSPVAIYVVGPDAPACAQRFAEALARALDALARTLPRGPVAADVAAAIVQERDGAAMRAAGGDSVHVHSGHGTSWTVVAEHDAAWRAGPLHRFVRVHPVPDVADLTRAVRPIARHLSSVGLAAGPSAIPDLEAALWRFGATRICPPGHMQAPPVDWPHDGRPILAPLARIGVREAARPG